MTTLEAALDYAARGLPVLPVFGVIPYASRFICFCGKGLNCEHPGKHPMGRYAPNGFRDATTDTKKIEWWWECVPTANIGIAPVRNCVVLDVDPKHGGDVALDQFEKRHSELPATWTVKTGSGGWHYYFSVDVAIRNTVSQVGPGLDFKGAANGYVVAPPSRHVSGNQYAWVSGRAPDVVPLAAMPAWLTAVALGPVSTSGRKIATPAAAWRELVLNGVGEGARNDAIARIAGHLLRRYIDPVVTLELAQVWNTVRCRPPLDDREVEAIVDRIAGCELKRRGAAHG